MELSGELRVAGIFQKLGKCHSAKMNEARVTTALKINLGFLHQAFIDDDLKAARGLWPNRTLDG